MSAVTVLQPAVETIGRAGDTRVRHLRLVGADERAVRRTGDPVRLTVRGRRLVAGLVLVVTVAAAFWTASMMTGDASVPNTVTVAPGQTLSEVAARHLPDLPRGTAVSQIQRANGLSSMHVSAGQQLTIPRV